MGKTITVLLYGTGEKHSTKKDKHFFGCLAEDLKEDNCWIYDGPNSAKDEFLSAAFSKDMSHNQNIVKDVLLKLKKEIATLSDGEKITLNLCGHSRGAVNALKIANAIAQDDDLKQKVEINIIANDPVAGPGLKSKQDATNIPSNVNHYIAFISQHEDRFIMKAQDEQKVMIEDPYKTSCSFLTLPGNHTSFMRDKHEADLISQFSAKIFSIYAYKFLKKHGAEFIDNLSYSAKYRQGDKRDGNEFKTVEISEQDCNDSKVIQLYEEAYLKALKLKMDNSSRSRSQYDIMINNDYRSQKLKSLDDTIKVADNVKTTLKETVTYICERYIKNRHYLGKTRTHANYAESLIEDIKSSNDTDAVLTKVQNTCESMKKKGISSDLLDDLEYLYKNASIKPEASKHKGIFTKIGERLFSLTGLSYLARFFRKEPTDAYLSKRSETFNTNLIFMNAGQNEESLQSEKTKVLADNI